MSRFRHDDLILGLEPTLYPPTARELAESQDVREEFLRRVAARRGVEPSALRDAMRRHAVAADDETSGWGRADGSEAGAPADVPEAPPTLHGCAEAWPNLPTGAAGAALPCPSPTSHASRWPGAGRLLLRALCLAALAFYVAAALGLACLAALGDR